MTQQQQQQQQSSRLIKTAACELEALQRRRASTSTSSLRNTSTKETTLLPLACSMPAACQRLVRSLPGNLACMDCSSPNPEWACVSYGTLLCLHCSGRHRSYGVQTSFVQSLCMDAWENPVHILAMLEGGNAQLQRFFQRHHLIEPHHHHRSAAAAKKQQIMMDLEQDKTSSLLCSKRYQTKAAKFYREQLYAHVQRVAQAGPYQGREANRGIKRRDYSASASSNNKQTTSSAAATRLASNDDEQEVQDQQQETREPPQQVLVSVAQS